MCARAKLDFSFDGRRGRVTALRSRAQEAGWAGAGHERNATPLLRPLKVPRWLGARRDLRQVPEQHRYASGAKAQAPPPAPVTVARARCRLLPFPPLGKRTHGLLSRDPNYGLGSAEAGTAP